MCLHKILTNFGAEKCVDSRHNLMSRHIKEYLSMKCKYSNV